MTPSTFLGNRKSELKANVCSIPKEGTKFVPIRNPNTGLPSRDTFSSLIVYGTGFDAPHVKGHIGCLRRKGSGKNQYGNENNSNTMSSVHRYLLEKRMAHIRTQITEYRHSDIIGQSPIFPIRCIDRTNALANAICILFFRIVFEIDLMDAIEPMELSSQKMGKDSEK